MKMREIEYYRLWTGNGGDSGMWDTDFVAIPSDTPEDKIEQGIRILGDTLKEVMSRS